MSLSQRIKQGFLRQPFVKKAILVASAGLMLSSVLPWYDNRNSFGVGDTFLGIQSPLFLVGYLVLGFGLISFLNMFLPLMGRKFFGLKKKGGITAVILGLQALFAIAIANSVFYHPSFGANISHKATRFGMLVAFGSIGVMIIAGWVAHKKELAGKYDDIDDVFTNPEPAKPVTSFTPKPAPNLSSTPRATYSTPSVSSSTPTPRPAPRPTPEPYSGGGAGVDPLTLDAKTRYKMMQSQQRYSSGARNNLWGSGNGSAYSQPSTVHSEAGDEGNVSDGMKIRMDL